VLALVVAPRARDAQWPPRRVAFDPRGPSLALRVDGAMYHTASRRGAPVSLIERKPPDRMARTFLGAWRDLEASRRNQRTRRRASPTGVRTCLPSWSRSSPCPARPVSRLVGGSGPTAMRWPRPRASMRLRSRTPVRSSGPGIGTGGAHAASGYVAGDGSPRPVGIDRA
jgi:hypothetical protein